MANQSLIVIGGGLAGLMATIKSAEMGVPVKLFSLVPVKRSHSVCAQGGINGAVNTKGEGDSPWQHFDDTVYGGDFLANQPPVQKMAEAAPKIIHMFDLEVLPQHVIIVGAGYIAFEFAHILRRFGCDVTLLVRSRALKPFDRKVVKRLVDETIQIGIDVRYGIEPVDINGDVVTLSDDSTLEGLVLNATGRIPSIERLRLDAAGIESDHGGVLVNEFLQTTNPNVYAAGDVAKSRNPALTPFAGQEGRIAALNLLRNNTRPLPERPAPTVVFTTPPIAKVGLTVDEAKAQGIDYECKDNDLSHFLTYERINDTTAFSRILLSKDGHVLGAHLIGQHAPELINLFSFIIQNNMTHQHVKHLEFAYPTSASDISYLI